LGALAELRTFISGCYHSYIPRHRLT
jgi:hypothetical protein